MKIIKAEILFSRKCNLKCSYCSMADGRENTLSVPEWITGMQQLKKLDCGFMAFYGAEPLLEFEKLVEVLPYVENILNIPTTIITNGTLLGTKEKLRELNKLGLRSLSMSYDPSPLDSHSSLKSLKAIDMLLWFKNLKNIRDVAAIATLTKQNFRKLPKMVKLMSKHGIWTFYDLYHFDRHQPGSKTSEIDNKLCFSSTDSKALIKVLSEVNRMRNNGYLIHTNEYYLDVLKSNNLNYYGWNCADFDEFPSWLTIDCDGSVYPCDDFQPKTSRKFQVTNIVKEWDKFKKQMKLVTKSTCPGCLWNTHLGAHAIKAGVENITDYIHGEYYG